MTPPHRSDIAASADQLMRRMLNAVARLQSTCSQDEAELKVLREKRQADIAAAERSAREQAQHAIASVQGLSATTSLGTTLRSELARQPTVSVLRADPGNTPESLAAAVAEWRTLAPAAKQAVADFGGAISAWSQRVLKRSRSMPTVPGNLWRDLDRLDLIHRSIQPLTQAEVANAIRIAAGSADVLIQAEQERQRASQNDQAREINRTVAAVESSLGLAGASWADARWGSPEPASEVERLIRLGELCLPFPVNLGVHAVPALAGFPLDAGLAIGSDVDGRDSAIELVRSLILRLFAAVPPGRLHVKVVDPVALGRSVAEFRHLSDYAGDLMDEKSWTSERDIERLMGDLSEHLQIVISKYLRGQFESIVEYNEHAAEVAQPYRVLVVFDYPTGFSERASNLLLSLIENGARCGVYVILHYSKERAADGYPSPTIERLIHDMQTVTFGAARPTAAAGAGVPRTEFPTLRLSAPVGPIEMPLQPDTAPPLTFDHRGKPETSFARLLPEIGTQVRNAQQNPPTVTLESLLPVLAGMTSGAYPDLRPGSPTMTLDKSTWWNGTTARQAVAPIGRSGVQAAASMYFSSTEVAGGAIMIGLPRSGKTTSLHSMIMTLSMLYSPDELELYLIDAKHGVEFKVYERLPHARMVSIRSEREFSLAVLKGIEKEIARRAEMMKAHGAGLANLTEYRAATGEQVPRMLLVIDEFHELFEETDSVGLDAFSAFSNIVRMGPFSGTHVVVASQTLSNMPAMDRPTLTLLPQRVAFMCNEYDSEIVMGESNRATRLLTKTGEGLFNPARGEESKNQPFRGLYIPTEQRTSILAQMQDLADQRNWTRRPRVFDGDTVADRPRTQTGLGSSTRLSIPIGEPFTLAEAEEITLARNRGSNILVLGDGSDEDSPDQAVRGAMHSVLLAAQTHAAKCVVIDFLGSDELPGIMNIADIATSGRATYVRSRGADSALRELAEIVEARHSAEDYDGPPRILVLRGLQRALSLVPFDPYSHDEGQTSPAKDLAAIIGSGPEVGVHVVITADRAPSLELRLGADLLAEVTLRVAGSSADQRDLQFLTGSFGSVPPSRHGQLLVSDLLKGTTRRARGYRPMMVTARRDEGDHD